VAWFITHGVLRDSQIFLLKLVLRKIAQKLIFAKKDFSIN